MLNPRSIETVDAYWASFLGCEVRDLNGDSPRIIRHRGELVDYFGLFAFFRKSTPVISLPDDQFETLSRFLKTVPAADFRQPGTFALTVQALRSEVVGPAMISYGDGDTLKPTAFTGRILTLADRTAAEVLQAACSEEEWEHGGSKVDEQATCGIFVGRQLAALAGYSIWSDVIAQICVVTHPDFRGRGYGRQVVAQLAQHAVEEGLIPQYRTLESNGASARMGEALGFERLATSVAVNFGNPVSS